MPISQCQNPQGCGCTNVETFYQHVLRTRSINHHWSKKPSEGPTPSSAPYPAPCPTDPEFSSPPIYTICPDCGYVKTW